MIPITPVSQEHFADAGMEGAVPVARDIQHYLRPGLLQLSSLPPLALYVHIPWCLKKCPYCDFNSHAHDADGVAEQAYVEALISDLEVALPMVWGRRVHAVFLGGGTPSLFSPEAIDTLLAAIRARLPLEPDCEITMEANPGTFEKDRFRAFADAGVSRLSIGVQSFHDGHLSALGRVHDRAQALAAVEEAASAFRTFNLDIMYALPGQTLADMELDLATALQFAPPHLSIYHLTIEANTYFAKYPPLLPDDDSAFAMLDRITEMTAAAGLERYEVSAFAKAGHRSRHNLNYWQFGDYLGIGAGAHSKISFAHRLVRQVRMRDPGRYMERAKAGNALAQESDIAHDAIAFEYLLNATRLRHGFGVADFQERTGLVLGVIERQLQEAERLGFIERDFARIRPTAKGFDFLNDLQALFLPEQKNPT